MTERERNQKAKQWLKRYGDSLTDIERLKAELEHLTAKQEGAKAIQYTDMPRAPGIDGDLSDLFAQRDEIRRRIIKAMTRANGIMAGVQAAIEQVQDPGERAVLSARYIQRLKWEDVAEATYYSISWVYEVHGRALGSIYDIVFRNGNTG